MIAATMKSALCSCSLSLVAFFLPRGAEVGLLLEKRLFQQNVYMYLPGI